MSADSFTNRYRGYSYSALARLQRLPDPVKPPIPVRVHQPANELSRVALYDDLLPLRELDPAQMLLARPVLREQARPVPRCA